MRRDAALADFTDMSECCSLQLAYDELQPTVGALKEFPRNLLFWKMCIHFSLTETRITFAGDVPVGTSCVVPIFARDGSVNVSLGGES